MTVVDIESIIGDLEQPERTVRICLKGKLVGEHEDLERQLSEAQVNAVATMGGTAKTAELAQQIRDLEQQMDAASVVFRVRGISYFEREEWLKANPPREGVEERFNPLTGAPSLIAACLVEPAATVEQARRLMEKAGTGQADKLFSACLQAIGEDGAVPFSVAASATLRALAPKPE
jgi:hypothetical protein